MRTLGGWVGLDHNRKLLRLYYPTPVLVKICGNACFLHTNCPHELHFYPNGKQFVGMNIAIQQLAKNFSSLKDSWSFANLTHCQDIEKGPSPILGQTEHPLPSIPYYIQWSIFSIHWHSHLWFHWFLLAAHFQENTCLQMISTHKRSMACNIISR